MIKKWFKTVCAAATAAALVMSAGTAVFAESADSTGELPVLGELDLSEVEASQTPMTMEIDVTGTVEAASLGEISLNVDAVAVADPAAGAQSLTGSFSTSGINYSFAEYMDSEKVMLQIPGFPKVLSYNYTKDPAGSPLAQIVGEDGVRMINNVLSLVGNTMAQGPEFAQYVSELNQVLTEQVAGIEFEPAPDKDCYVGESTVTCSGMQTTLTKEKAESFIDALLGVHYPNGQTFEEYFQMIYYFSESEEVDIRSEIHETLADMPDITLAVYTNEAVPVEICLSTKDSTADDTTTVALQFRGEQIPFTDIRLVSDDEEVGAVRTEIDGSSLNIAVTVSGEMTVASIGFNMETGDFTVSTPYLPSPITGKIFADGETVTLSASYEGLSFECRAYPGGAASMPEGEVLELTELTEEELSAFASGLSSAVSGLSNAA